jgi:ATP-dependent Lon protease
VILPRENEPDLEELPDETKRELEFVLVDAVDQVFDAAFGGRRAAHPAPVAIDRRVAKSASSG